MEALTQITTLINVDSTAGPFVLAMLSLSVADLFTGVLNAFKKGEKITASGLKNTVIKTLHYSVAVLLSELLQGVFVPEIALTKIVAGYICLTESKSIFENINKATGVDIWKKITGSTGLK